MIVMRYYYKRKFRIAAVILDSFITRKLLAQDCEEASRYVIHCTYVTNVTLHMRSEHVNRDEGRLTCPAQDSKTKINTYFSYFR